MFRRTTLLLLALLLTPCVQSADLEPGPYVIKPLSAEFQRLADLVGEWKGVKEEPGGEDEEVSVEYKLTSGNSALVERLFKDSPMEMTSVYHDAVDGLMMTHYCGLGNQPRYHAAGFEGDSITFDFHDASNMATPKEMHMHGVKLTMPSADELVQTWQHYHDGKSAGTVTVRLTRVK
jgi:hypothetical protein